MRTTSRWVIGLGTLLALAAGTVCVRSQDAKPEPAPRIDREHRTVTIPATLHPEAFRAGDPPGHHLVTWSGGRAGHKALLETPVSDTAVLDALESLGGHPGNTLTEEAWTHRQDPDDPAPDRRAEGTLLQVHIRLPDGTERDISELLEDVDGHGFAWRLAGNRALIPVWRSGCVVCLQSCPGAKVANRQATMRDLAQGHSRFRLSPLARKLGEGAHLQVIFLLPPEPGDGGR